MIPLFSLTIIPTELDVEIDAALVEVHPEIVLAFCLASPYKVRYAQKLPDTPAVEDIINSTARSSRRPLRSDLKSTF